MLEVFPKTFYPYNCLGNCVNWGRSFELIWLTNSFVFIWFFLKAPIYMEIRLCCAIGVPFWTKDEDILGNKEKKGKLGFFLQMSSWHSFSLILPFIWIDVWPISFLLHAHKLPSFTLKNLDNWHFSFIVSCSGCSQYYFGEIEVLQPSRFIHDGFIVQLWWPFPLRS
jgi:hypothetical protein